MHNSQGERSGGGGVTNSVSTLTVTVRMTMSLVLIKGESGENLPQQHTKSMPVYWENILLHVDGFYAIKKKSVTIWI